MTVGELKEKLKDVPDDLLVVEFHNNMEKQGIMKAFPSCEIMRVKERKIHTYDRFDYTDYTYTVYERDNKGDKEVFYI